ncbi:DUF6701 domain-containing protein [Thermodesulfobacteriota bacterium]
MHISSPETLNAACSSYKSRATINEVHNQGSNEYYVEVKLLDTNIQSAVYDNWTITICYKKNPSDENCSATYDLSDGDQTDYPYQLIGYGIVGLDQKFFYMDKQMDVILKDNSGKTIDYLSIGSYYQQQDTDCTPAYDWESSSTTSHTLARFEDGSGEWSAVGPGGSINPTEGGSNDPLLPGNLARPTIDISNVAVVNGTTADFTFTLSVPISSYPDQLTDFEITFDYQTIDDTALAATHYTATSGTITFPVDSPDGDTQTVSVPTASNCTAGSDLYFWLFLDNQVNASLINHFAIGTIQYPGGASADHFDIDHDGAGINCLAEAITVTVEDSGNNPITCYVGTITLDTGTLKGTWTEDPGNNGTFNDATPNDGLAEYTYDSADNGVASFYLDYQEGSSPINISVTEGIVSDDDNEGWLTFSPSGFTVTASALSNPPPNPINEPIPAQTAGTVFDMHIAAYGQTDTDPICGIIEAYDGAQTLKFWSTYDDPNGGTLQVSIDSNPIATAEGSAAGQAVTFASGKAEVDVKYKDVGQIRISMKDDTVSEPVLGITGASNLFVVRPDDFVLTTIVRESSPGVCSALPADILTPVPADQTGTPTIKAGDNFCVTVNVLDFEDDPTPNYGQESTPETVLLDPTIVAAGGANNPVLQITTGFDFTLATGAATGTGFSWGEVGIITLTPRIGDLDYLGAGDVIGTISGNVGRFTPFDLNVVGNTPDFSPGCPGTTSFTYVDQPFDYSTAPSVTITARNAAGGTTTNYDNAWWKLADFVETYSQDAASPLPGAITLDDASAGHTAVSCTDCDGTLTIPFNSPFTYAKGTGSPQMPFNSVIDISFSVTDSDGIAYAANPFTFNNIVFTGGDNQIRWGRLFLASGFGPDTEDIIVPVTIQEYSASGFTTNSDDECTGLTDLPAIPPDWGDINLSGYTDNLSQLETTPSITAFTTGDAAITLSAPGSGNDGNVTVQVDLSVVGADMTWLQHDWDSDNVHDNNPTATATFGIYRGNDRIINWQEIVR